MGKKDKKKKKKYYLADQDKITKKMEELDSGTFFKPKEGKNTIRILPPWSKEKVWYKEATMHYSLTNKEGQDRVYPCLKMFDEDCPVCDRRDEMLEGSAEEQKAGDKLRPRTKYFANIIDRKSSKVMIWSFSAKTLGILLSYCGDPDYGDITHPEDGFDVIIERTGTGMLDTRYAIRVRPRSSEIDVDGWDSNLPNLDKEVIKEMSFDELAEIVDTNFDAKPSRSKTDEDDDLDDDDDDDEDDEEEAPKKKKGKKKKEEEEEEEDDEEDDEEEEVKDDEDDEEEDEEEEEEDDEEDEEDDEPSSKKKKKSRSKDRSTRKVSKKSSRKAKDKGKGKSAKKASKKSTKKASKSKKKSKKRK